MKTIDVLTLVGGIGSASLNQRLYREIVRHNQTGISFRTFDIASLPFYSQDIENDPPEEVKALRGMAGTADAVLVITPEYNRSMPGVLKNALDWCSRPPGENRWSGKPAAIMGASTGAIGTFGAQQHLRNVCSFLNMHLMSQPEFYFNASTGMDANGLTESSVKFLQKFLTSFEEWAGRFKV